MNSHRVALTLVIPRPAVGPRDLQFGPLIARIARNAALERQGEV
jgi:hypothetical protein